MGWAIGRQRGSSAGTAPGLIMTVSMPARLSPRCHARRAIIACRPCFGPRAGAGQTARAGAGQVAGGVRAGHEPQGTSRSASPAGGGPDSGVCAVLAGARSYTAVAEWAADVDPDTRAALGIIGPVPSESTFRRVLQRLDADRLDEVLGAWAAAAGRPPAGRRRRVAVDGKTLRGSGGAGSPAHHLLAALDHDHGVVLAQVDVYAKTNEVPTAGPARHARGGGRGCHRRRAARAAVHG